MVQVEKFTAKITTVGDSKGVIIPAHILKYTGLEKGVVLEVTISPHEDKKLGAARI